MRRKSDTSTAKNDGLDVGECNAERKTGTSRKRIIDGPGGVLPIKQGDEAAVDLAMLIEGETSGLPLERVLEKFGSSRSTYYELRCRFQREGMAGLGLRRPGPREPWRRTYDVVRHIVMARLEDADRSAAAIAGELTQRGYRVSPRSVERTLSQFGLTRKRGEGA